MEPASLRAARGATLLDNRRPGWAGMIDEDRLNLWDTDTCTLGQIYGYYSDGLDVLFLGEIGDPERHEFAVAHGFYSAVDPDEYESRQAHLIAMGADYAELRVAWIAEIRRRLAPVPIELPAVVVVEVMAGV